MRDGDYDESTENVFLALSPLHDFEVGIIKQVADESARPLLLKCIEQVPFDNDGRWWGEGVDVMHNSRRIDQPDRFDLWIFPPEFAEIAL